MKYFIILFFHICFSQKMLWAQEDNKKAEQMRLRLASGATVPLKNDGVFISSGLGVFMTSSKHFSYGVNINYNTFLNLLDENRPDYRISFDGLVGKRISGDKFYAGISSGISFITGLNSKEIVMYDMGTYVGTNTEKNYFNTIGLPLDIEIGLLLKNNKVFGINSVSNFNREQPFTAIRLFLQFGEF